MLSEGSQLLIVDEFKDAMGFGWQVGDGVREKVMARGSTKVNKHCRKMT
jgi:hypothetical protein